MKKRQQSTEPNWNRLRTLINVGLKAVGIKPIEGKITVDGTDQEMEVLYGFSVHWDKQFTVLLATVIRGCYRTRNGDGWPDDVDVSEIKSFQTSELFDLARFVVGEVARLQIDSAFECFGENEILAEQPASRFSPTRRGL